MKWTVNSKLLLSWLLLYVLMALLLITNVLSFDAVSISTSVLIIVNVLAVVSFIYIGFVSGRKSTIKAVNALIILVLIFVIAFVFNNYEEENLASNYVDVSISAIYLLLNVASYYLGYRFSTPEKNIIDVDNDMLNNLITALGGKNNISSVDVSMSRAKFVLNDIDDVNVQAIKDIGATGIFISGDSLQAIFGENAKSVINHLKEQL